MIKSVFFPPFFLSSFFLYIVFFIVSFLLLPRYTLYHLWHFILYWVCNFPFFCYSLMYLSSSNAVQYYKMVYILGLLTLSHFLIYIYDIIVAAFSNALPNRTNMWCIFFMLFLLNLEWNSDNKSCNQNFYIHCKSTVRSVQCIIYRTLMIHLSIKIWLVLNMNELFDVGRLANYKSRHDCKSGVFFCLFCFACQKDKKI